MNQINLRFYQFILVYWGIDWRPISLSIQQTLNLFQLYGQLVVLHMTKSLLKSPLKGAIHNITINQGTLKYDIVSFGPNTFQTLIHVLLPGAFEDMSLKTHGNVQNSTYLPDYDWLRVNKNMFLVKCTFTQFTAKENTFLTTNRKWKTLDIAPLHFC